jgi:hypothetical protein
LYTNHPELTAIGFNFSPIGVSHQKDQLSDPEKTYKNKVSIEVDK